MDATSGYHTLSEQPPAPNTDDYALVLHEYCVPNHEADHFVTLFYFVKRQLQTRLFA